MTHTHVHTRTESQACSFAAQAVVGSDPVFLDSLLHCSRPHFFGLAWCDRSPRFVWPRARVSEDAIRHDNFHSKSYAVQRACLAAFDDMELIAEAVAKAYEGST